MVDPNQEAEKAVDLDETLDLPVPTDEDEEYDTIDPQDGVKPVDSDPFETWEEND